MAMRSRLLWLCTALVFELHALVVQHVPTARLPALSTRRSLALPLATATDAGQATLRTAAVVGAGPAGALTAIMLAQRGWRVRPVKYLSDGCAVGVHVHGLVCPGRVSV